jgi:hypothetical protein
MAKSVKNTSQPPYTPQQAAARSKQAPSGGYQAGKSQGSRVGEKGGTKGMFKPGLRAGPGEGKHGR